MQMVWENAPCRENSLLILLALADWANEDGHCWPSMQKLAEKARVDRRSAQRIVRKLAEQGLIKTHEGGGRANQNQYTIERAALCRPPSEKGDIDDTKRATLETETATFPTQRAALGTQTATRVSPDPLEEPSEEPLKQPPLEPPYSGSEFLRALAAYDRTAKRRKVKESPEQREALFTKLSRWGESAATEALVNTVANSWQGVFEPKRNGNGQSYQADTNPTFEFTPESRIS